MKKILLICFLALLCLAGSETQAKVASPRDSLVDLPAPPDPLVSSSEDTLGQGRREVGYFTLLGEVKSNLKELPDLRFELVERELDSQFNLGEIKSQTISSKTGSFFAGNPGMQTFSIRLPLNDPFARFGLWDHGQVILENIWVQPGDSIAIRWDSDSGKILISGPQALNVRVQVQLQQLALSHLLTINPVMILSDSMAILNSEAKLQEYGQIQKSYFPGWNRKMEWLETEASRIKRAEQLFEFASESHPVFRELDRYKGELNTDLYHWLGLYWQGNLRKLPLRFTQISKPGSANWGALILNHTVEDSLLNEAAKLGLAPSDWIESIYLENWILEKLIPVSFLHLTESFPSGIRDQVNALYLIREYKNLSNADSLFSKVLDEVQSPWIAQSLDQLYRSNLEGNPLINFPFTGQIGEEIYPGSWKGKLVFIDFWLSGCGSCISFAKDQFFPLMEEFKDHPDILFVTISGDKDQKQWKESLTSGRYSTDQSLNLFSGGTGHPTLSQYLIRSFPAQLLLDREGRILKTGSFPDTSQGWVQLFKTYLSAPDTQEPKAELNPNQPK